MKDDKQPPKVHWTKTPEGRARLSEQMKRAHRRKRREVKKSGAAKPNGKGGSRALMTFPLDIIPAREPRPQTIRATPVHRPPPPRREADARELLALELIRAVRDILK